MSRPSGNDFDYLKFLIDIHGLTIYDFHHYSEA
jgi:hypothetical protein